MALGALDELGYDVVITDLQMPGGDGRAGAGSARGGSSWNERGSFTRLSLRVCRYAVDEFVHSRMSFLAKPSTSKSRIARCPRPRFAAPKTSAAVPPPGSAR